MPETTHARLETLAERPQYLRAPVATGLDARPADRIDRDGGLFRAGLIRGVSLCTHGEALGHGLWLDREFIASVVDSGATADKGLKARFTHPGLSGDGLGTFLGRFLEVRLSDDGEKAVGDLHFSTAAHKTPDGDLASYIMDLAETDPDMFATSIVYQPDWEAEDAHFVEHGGKIIDDELGFVHYDDSDYASPDPANTGNLMHARLAGLRACDCVDDPAANPEGLFHREQQFAQEADAVMAYAVGLSDRAPDTRSFSVHPDRIKAFLSRFLASHDLEIQHKETPMADETQGQADAPKADDEQTHQTDNQADTPKVDDGQTPETTAGQDGQATAPKTDDPAPPEDGQADEPNADSPGPADQRAELRRFCETFGEADGAKWYLEGFSFEAAQQAYTSRLKAENESLKKRLDSAATGEPGPVATEPTGQDPQKTFADVIRIRGRK